MHCVHVFPVRMYYSLWCCVFVHVCMCVWGWQECLLGVTVWQTVLIPWLDPASPHFPLFIPFIFNCALIFLSIPLGKYVLVVSTCCLFVVLKVFLTTANWLQRWEWRIFQPPLLPPSWGAVLGTELNIHSSHYHSFPDPGYCVAVYYVLLRCIHKWLT